MIHTNRNPTRERAKKGGPPFFGETRLPTMEISGSILLLVATLAALWVISLYNFLLFHAIAEGFAIIIACGVFMLTWNSRRLLDNNYLLLVGMAYAFIGAIDLLHTLAYPGMGVFVGYRANLTAQLWIGARYMEALTFLAAPLMLTLRIRPRLTVLAYAGATALLIAAVFSGVFPACFIEGSGITVFKVASEYVVCGLLVTSAVFLCLKRSAFEPGVLYMLLASICLTILSELSFTLYSDPYDFFNLMGHFLKLVSFYLIYRAVIVTGLARPYDLLYRRLNESERRYRSLFSTMTEAFALHEIITGQDGTPTDYRFIEINPAFENLTGLEREKVVGRTVREVLPNTKDYWIDIYGKVALTGDPAHIERYSAKLKRWYEAFIYQTEPGRFAGLFTDITERKQAEERTQEEHCRTAFANRVLRAFIECEGDDVFDQALAVVLKEMASRHGVFGYISQPGHLICASMSKLLSACEIESKCIHYPPEKWKGLWAQALTEKRSLYTNEAPPVPPGHPIIHNNLATPILLHGEVIGLLNIANKDGGYTDEDSDRLDGLATRIAPILYAWIQRHLREEEHKAAEVALRESEEKLALATSGTQVGIFDRNLLTGEIAATEQNVRLLGMPPAAAAGTRTRTRTTLSQFYGYSDWAERVHPEDLPGVEAEMERCMAQHTPFESEYRVIWPDDSVHWLAARGIFQYDDEGQPMRLLGILMDITDRRQAEEKIREMNQELERRVAERTQQLQALTMELFDAENRERQRLSQMLHDELQQQLAAIKLRISSLVHEEGVTPAVHKRIQDTVSMVDDAIAESRSLSRELYPTTLRMHGLFSALQQLSKDMNRKHGLELSLELAPEADVRSERIGAILYQAVRELLFNVVKHSGALEASVAACCADHEIRISVRDSGRGVNPDWMRDKAQQSSSLGLKSIEERIVYLGGRVEIEGDPGKGCCVTLGLPVDIAEEGLPAPGTEDEAVSASAARTVAATDAPELPESERIQILLIDDHDLMRESLASELAKEPDFDVIGQASDGVEGVKLTIELAPDVVLMDVNMPGMTGIEATARIREKFPHAVVIGLTMYSDSATGDRMREAGAEEMLSKSGTIRQLCAAIREHDGRGRKAGEP
ncbi:MAG: MASE3 domain-containing protein [Pseudomonadota bacterium]